MVFLTDDEKRILLDRYRDIEWCDDVTGLRCVFCHRVAIDHHVSCGYSRHLVCNDCKEEYVDEDSDLECPECSASISPMDGKSMDVEVKIHQLRIFCPNKKYGCKYLDQLGKMPSHLMTCVNTPENAFPSESPATNTMNDVVIQLRSLNATIGELSKRMKVVDSVKEKLTQMEIKFDDMDCKMDANLSREDKKVKETKEFQLMTLKLKSVNQRIQENESIFEQKMEQLTLKIEELSTKMNALAEQKEQLQKKRSEKPISLKAKSYEWTVKDANIYQENVRHESEVFNIAGCKFDIKAKFEGKKISLQFKDGDKINEFLDTELGFKNVKYIIRDQSNTKKKSDIHRQRSPTFGFDCHNFDWIVEYCLPDEAMSPPYMKDNCVKITILLEPQLMDCSFNNGVLMWRVDNYEDRKQNPLIYDNRSPCFYTSPQGYRVRMILSIKDHSMSVDVGFIAGKYDAMLSYDFPHKTTVTLINQLDLSKNLMWSRQREDVHVYTITFPRSHSVEQKGFIKGDSLLFKVVIEPLTRN